MISRRSLFLGSAALLAAPSIVRVSSLMPVSVAAVDVARSAADLGWVHMAGDNPHMLRFLLSIAHWPETARPSRPGEA